MKKLSFASPILFTTILLFAAACGKNTAAETVPPQTQIASESDFSEETSMTGQTDSITPESSATDLIGNAPSETASGSNSNGREFDTLKSKKVPQILEIGLFFCQIFIFII